MTPLGDAETRKCGDTAKTSQDAASPRRTLTTSELEPLPRDFYLRPTVEVARDLLGRHLVLERPGSPAHVARLVETEAYLGEEDLACHASHGHTKRTAPMYEEAGHAYIYFVYGMYWCLNVVTEAVGRPYAVLLRAGEAISDLPAMNGPGKLCRAFGLDGTANRADLTSSGLRVAQGVALRDDRVGISPRIGVGYAGRWATEPLRFFDVDSRAVSRPASRRRRAPRDQVFAPAPEAADFRP